MSFCVLAAGKTMLLAASFFTLGWTHSVEQTRWEEDWRVIPSGLQIVEARVQGSGAGMEVPDGAELAAGWWRYVPDLPVQPSLVLAASGATGAGWSLCMSTRCLELGARDLGQPIEIRPCVRKAPRWAPYRRSRDDFKAPRRAHAGPGPRI